jgi:RNA polymerase sigma-70 factor (ECF subfamily)
VTLDDVFREEWGRSVAILARATGDPALAEDAVQDAFAAAVERWGTVRLGTPAPGS